MHHHHEWHGEIPKLGTLGGDLLLTTRRQRWLALVRPFLGLGLYVLAAALGWWALTLVIVFLVFVAVVTATHDVVHNTLGLSKRQTEWALFITGAFLLNQPQLSYSPSQGYRAFPIAYERNT